MLRWPPSPVQCCRFTPTPVGNAANGEPGQYEGSVHPHACGECLNASTCWRAFVGSPPRLWGMLRLDVSSGLHVRFTPTPVGNADLAASHERAYAVHPHACGECHYQPNVRPKHLGSPPRLWGMRDTGARHLLAGRFTPTPVGNAPTWCAVALPPAVHPHACGECVQLPTIFVKADGSPPRLWGMLVVGLVVGLRFRFTPTPVGNATDSESGCRWWSVHPHACGECASMFQPFSVESGSPPRLWGMHDMTCTGFAGCRFTPTPVGNAAGAASPCRPAPVHPHACGECSISTLLASSASGSPPRLWGMHADGAGQLNSVRFTPTPVGNAAAQLFRFDGE